MPKHKDLKRLVRGRMKKTGESYTAARTQLLEKTKQSKNGRPVPADYVKLAGMSDAAVRAKTGRSWKAWVRVLDAAGAVDWPHSKIARYVHEQHEVPGWWAQTVTVGYERIRGLREIGQRRDGSYEVNKSKTITVPIGKLYRAFAHVPTRRRWLSDKIRIRSATLNKTMRIAWHDGSSVEAYFYKKDRAKAQVTIQHRKLPDKATVARMKTFWSERFAALAEVVKES